MLHTFFVKSTEAKFTVWNISKIFFLIFVWYDVETVIWQIKLKNSLIWKLVHPCTKNSNLITKLESDFSLRTSLLVYFGFLLKYETIPMVYSKIVSIKQRVEANKIVSRKNSMNPNFSNNCFPKCMSAMDASKIIPNFQFKGHSRYFQFLFCWCLFTLEILQ